MFTSNCQRVEIFNLKRKQNSVTVSLMYSFLVDWKRY